MERILEPCYKYLSIKLKIAEKDWYTLIEQDLSKKALAEEFFFV